MKLPVDRKYSETHEWFLVDGDEVTVGITQFAADQLTDITFVDLPSIGTTIKAGDAIGEVESVKATSEIFTAVAGRVIAINDTLADHPEQINDDAFDAGWLVKLKAESTEPVAALMDPKEYKQFVRASV